MTTSAMSQANTSANATTSNTVRETSPSRSYAAHAATSTARADRETRTSRRGIRRTHHDDVPASTANAAPATLASTLWSTSSALIGTMPTPASASPITTTSARTTPTALRRTPGMRSRPWARRPAIAAIAAPESTSAPLKHTAARSPDVPRVLKLRAHHAPVEVRLMLARHPAASTIATTLNDRYADRRCARRWSAPVSAPMVPAASAPIPA
ncbi:hypothetical protein [Agromyces arachidis]|uniref:hypothetical protein n=1 Tax=Agromyces arachidis TaxID=766966 RepID=UPI004055A528